MFILDATDHQLLQKFFDAQLYKSHDSPVFQANNRFDIVYDHQQEHLFYSVTIVHSLA